MPYIIYSFLVTLFIAVCLTRSTSFGEKIANGILIYLGVCGLFSFLLKEYFNVSYADFPKILSIVVTLILLLGFKNIKNNLTKENYYKDVKLNSIGNVILSFFLISIFIRGFSLPVNGWDAYALYDTRGKIFSEGGTQRELAKLSKYDQTNPLYYFSYPPMTSSIHAVLYSASFVTPMFIYPLFYIAIFLYIYEMLLEMRINNFFRYSILAISTVNPLIFQQITSAYTNLPMMAFQWGALHNLLIYKKNNSFYRLLLASFLLAFSVWTRVLEPTYVVFILLALYILLGKKLSVLTKTILILLFSVITILPKIIWSLYIKENVGYIGDTAPGINTIIFRLADSIYLSRMLEVAFFVYQSLFQIKYYLIIFLVIICYTLFGNRKLRQFRDNNSNYVTLLILGIIGLMVVGTVYLSASFEWWDQIGGSFLRSNLIIIPLVAINAALLIDEYKEK